MRAKLEDFLQEVCEKTITNNQYPVLTSSKSGLFLQSDYFNKQVASKDNTGYKIIRRGQFTYRAMSDTGEFFPNMLECADVGIVSPAYPVFEIIKQDQIVPEYLNYYFKSNRFQNSISTFAQGSTRTSVKFGKLKKVSIELPEIKKQYQIIRTLDLLRTIINNRKKEVLELDELIRARFVEMFGTEREFERWSCCTIGDVAKVGVGVVIKPTQYYTDDGIPAFRSLNIGEMKVKDNDWVYFTEEGHKKNQKSVVKTNDVLVVRSGAPGTACVATEKYNGYNAVDIIIAHPDQDKVNSVFLAAFTNMPHGMNQIKGGTGGAAQQHFNVSGYKAMTLIMPPMRLQEQFADFVSQIDKSKATVQKALDETQLLFDSLMQQYFG